MSLYYLKSQYKVNDTLIEQVKSVLNFWISMLTKFQNLYATISQDILRDHFHMFDKTKR